MIREYIKVLPIGGNPNPATYCPANGYILDPSIYIPPVSVPESTEDSIIFICNAARGNFDLQTRNIELSANAGGAVYEYKVYDSANVLVDSFTSSVKWVNFNFPSNTGYYTVKITIQQSNYHFTGCWNSGSSVALEGCFEAAIFNTPSLYIFGLAGMKNLKSVNFISSVSSIGTMARSFEWCTSLEYFKIKSTDNNLPLLYNIAALFNYCYGLKSVDLSEMILTKQATTFLAEWVFGNARNCTDIKLPAYFPVTRLYGLFSGTLKLTNLQMFTNNDAQLTESLLSGVFYNCGYEGDIVFPELKLMPNTNISDFFNGCRARYVKMVGDWSNVTLANYIFNNMPLVEEIETPRKLSATIITGSSCFNTVMPALKKYIGPDVGFMGVPAADCPLQSITGESDTPTLTGTNQATVTIPTGASVRANLTVLQMVKLRVRRFLAGTTAATKFANLTTLEIDWANSSWADVTVPQLAISANLDSTEINRIFNALPVVSAKTLNLWFCTGYSAADKTIATNKGWLLAEAPAISTVAATNIARTSATLGGSNISTHASYPITTKGVCWSVNPNPTTSSSKATSTANTDDFIVSATGLTANRLYYFRAYATNSLGTTYGQQLTFTTLP